MLRLKLLAAVALLIGGAALVQADPPAQDAPTSTPVQINLSPAVQEVVPQQVGAATPTRTATPQGIALLEAKEFANVRSEPSTDSAQLGQIKVGETYNVIGRYISWIQFQYPSSPTGKGWVFGELVNLTGNVDNIPDIDPFAAQSPQDSVVSAETATQSILTQTPGGVLTATVLARIVPVTSEATALEPVGPQPTFTYPPGMVAIAPTPGAAVSTVAADDSAAVQAPSSDGVPPLVPIVILGGVGLLGLLISSIRRG